MDRISSLPDEIICHIGSFFSANEVAFTTVLSKRWHNLFTIILDLLFDSSVKDRESFTDFEDRVLALPASSRVMTFYLNGVWLERIEYAARYDLINRCLLAVLKRGVLNIHLCLRGKQGYSLPYELFACETVAELSLGGGFGFELVEAHSQATGGRKLEFIEDLEKLLGASSKCKFQVVS